MILRLLSPLVVAGLCMTAACVSVPGPIPEDAYVGSDGLYEVDPGLAYRPTFGGGVFDRAFTDREGAIVVGIVINGPALSLPELDDAVANNLKEGAGDAARILEVKDTSLSGLAARETRVHMIDQGRVYTMINLHTSTEDENIQVVIRGPTSRVHHVDALVDRLSGGGFRFLRDVNPFGAVVPSLADLPVEFGGLPQGWRAAAKGELNASASVELVHPDGLYLIGIIEEAGDVPFAAMRAVMQSNLAKLLSPSKPSADDDGAGPFDEQGRAPDASWSQSGKLREEGVPVTYRVRLLEDSGRFLHLYCWGKSEGDTTRERCSSLIGSAALKP